MTIVLWIVGMILVAVGIAGIVFPALPGTVLIFAGLLTAAWAEDFSRVSVWTMAAIGVIGALSYFVDFVAGALGAKHVGASRLAIVGAGLGTLLGLPLGLVGVFLGPLLGAVAGEWMDNQNVRRAAGVGMAAWIGFLLGTAVKVAMAFSMIAIFLVAVFFL